MKLVSTVILLFIFSMLTVCSTAQKTSSQTLLWRIAGNGLQKPSYLYGTMHLKDRRLFFFGDSVYKSIEASEGFAMELDPDEMMDSLFSKIGDADTSTLLRKLLDEKKFKSVAKKLEKKFGMPADKISRKQLMTERENWYMHIHKSDDMKTIVDLYLYDIAHKQGKRVGGIEDVSDQLGLTDELGKDVNINEYVDDDKDKDDQKKSYLEKMITLYAAEDIEKIDELINGFESQKYKDLLLINRNIKMASRMDSLAHIRNSFFAVGTAHLPGEAGLIQLLKAKGFQVTPVFSSKKIAPEKYSYTAKEIPWIKFSEPDSAYTVEMPGKPSDVKVAEEVAKFKAYADLVSNIFYMTGFSMFSTGEKPEALTDRMARSFLKEGFGKKEEKKITNRGNNGTEITALMGKIYYRLQIFPFADKVFIIMAGGEKKETLFSNDAERFFSGFAMNTNLAAKPNKWVTHTDELKAFDISFPKKPGIDKLKPGESVENIETTTYTAMDIASNTYYLVVVSDTKKGFVMSEDSLVFNAKLDFYKQNNSVIKDIRKFQYEDNGAISFSAQQSKDGLDYVTKILIICRGNRDYTIAAVTQKGKEDYPDITHFFRSFKLLPYKPASWNKINAHDSVFSTWAPASFEQQKPDTTGLSREQIRYQLIEQSKLIQFMAHEPNSATTYNVNIYPVPKYFHAKDDSSFITGELKTYYSDTGAVFAKSNPGHFDSLIYKKKISNGKVNGFEILVKNAGKSYYKRVRILPHGDSAYHLFTLAPYSFIINESNNKFFEDFRFAEEDLPSSIFQSKTAVLLADLTGTDSATRAGARAAIDDAKFDSTDLPLLYAAYLKKYPPDTTSYYTITDKIGDAINSLHDSSTISFVVNNYLTGTVNSPELKAGMLEMLANRQTVSGMLALKELLLKAPPVAGDPNAFISKLGDSLLLTKILFPEAARFFGDSLLGPGMLWLASDMIDSNILQRDILSTNLAGVLHTANRQLVQLQKDEYASYNSEVMNALAKINNPKSVGLLNSFLKMADLDVKQNAVLNLLKIGQKVSPQEIRKIAADKGYRTAFYSALKAIGKSQLFPAEFLTQQQFAEGYIYDYTLDDDDVNNTGSKLTGEKTAVINGKTRRFYLFRAFFDNDGEKESHLAICGGFDPDRKKVELKYDDLIVKIFYDEKYTPAFINKLFEQFIASEKDKSGKENGE